MSSQPPPPPEAAGSPARLGPPPTQGHLDGMTGVASWNDPIEKRIDEIEMSGEEEAAGFHPPGTTSVSAGMRYLHSSRTIHQLVTDRNRAVGIYLAVASLLWTASSALLNAKPAADLLVPIETIQQVCIPATFAILTILALFVGFLLIRTRIGLIYEVAKMNVLLGLPVGRVKRVNPLSIFFIMHALISLAGGASGGVLAYYLLVHAGVSAHPTGMMLSVTIGFAITLLLILLYIVTVLHTTADKKLQGSGLEDRG